MSALKSVRVVGGMVAVLLTPDGAMAVADAIEFTQASGGITVETDPDVFWDCARLKTAAADATTKAGDDSVVLVPVLEQSPPALRVVGGTRQHHPQSSVVGREVGKPAPTTDTRRPEGAPGVSSPVGGESTRPALAPSGRPTTVRTSAGATTS